MSALAAGALSIVSVGSTTDSLSSAAATGGTGPYTYQWYRSTITGFSPGPGNILTGQTALTLSDSGLLPSTPYFYVVVATDSVAATASSAQLTVNTAGGVQSQNQFLQSPIVGQLDLRFNVETVSVEIDLTQATPLVAGSAVKIVDSIDGIPKVVGCAANSDACVGFLNFDVKSQSFNAGDRAEMSGAGNVMYLVATGAISRFKQVTLDLTYVGGVAQAVTSSGNSIVGYAYDKATVAGQLIRVHLKTPSFAVA